MLKQMLKTTSARKDRKTVEKRLRSESLKLTETESRVDMFTKMLRAGVATNDVYNFVKKQS